MLIHSSDCRSLDFPLTWTKVAGLGAWDLNAWPGLCCAPCRGLISLGWNMARSSLLDWGRACAGSLAGICINDWSRWVATPPSLNYQWGWKWKRFMSAAGGFQGSVCSNICFNTSSVLTCVSWDFFIYLFFPKVMKPTVFYVLWGRDLIFIINLFPRRWKARSCVSYPNRARSDYAVHRAPAAPAACCQCSAHLWGDYCSKRG